MVTAILIAKYAEILGSVFGYPVTEIYQFYSKVFYVSLYHATTTRIQILSFAPCLLKRAPNSLLS